VLFVILGICGTVGVLATLFVAMRTFDTIGSDARRKYLWIRLQELQGDFTRDSPCVQSLLDELIPLERRFGEREDMLLHLVSLREPVS